MAGRLIQCRESAGSELRARCEAAAADCDMRLGAWVRAVLEGAVDAHEGIEVVESETHPGEFYELNRGAGTCTCLGFEHHGMCKHLADDEAEEVDVDAYAAALDDGLVDLGPRPDPVVVEHPATIATNAPVAPPAALAPRDCPHLPQWRRGGGVCRCGARISGGQIRRA
jgi:hypothetical protein